MEVRQSSRAEILPIESLSLLQCSTTRHKRIAVTMKAALLITVLASICLLYAEADTLKIPVQPDFDVKKIAGTWYHIAVALKNREMMDFEGVDDIVEASDNGDMFVKMRHIQDGKCKVTPLHLEHTDTPGRFIIPASNKTVHMVDVDYDSYNIVHIEQNDTYTLYLFSRKREVSDDVRTKFKTLAKALGFDVKKIFDEKQADSCPE